MSKILIWRQIIPGDGVDIFTHTDYTKLTAHMDRLYNGACPNWGNKLWFQGLYSEINTPENQITFRKDETIDYINQNFDLIIYPMANFFSVQYCSDTTEFTKILVRIKIPVYIIACGAQADSYDALDDLIEKIGAPASRFIEAIYHTGGEFCLRGDFTKEFFTKLGFPSAVVTGCPSMYQLGRNFRVNKHEALPTVQELKIAVNGHLKAFEEIMKEFPGSLFFDQDQFLKQLYEPGYLSCKNLRFKLSFYRHQGVYLAELIGKGRIKMFADIPTWYHYLRSNGFHYSFGTRIHGSIMALLAGIPVTVLAIDSRTREMADFFDIPYIEFRPDHAYSAEDVYSSYERADYGKLNASFSDKFDRYERFLIEHKIVTKLNEKNEFLSENQLAVVEEYHPNKEAFMMLAESMERKAKLLNLINGMVPVRRS